MHPKARTEWEQQLLEHLNLLIGGFGKLHHELTTQRGAFTTGGDYRPIVNGASGVLYASAGTLTGYSIRETAGAPAVVRVHDGRDASGDLLVTIGLAADESATVVLPHQGVGFALGLYVEIVSGAVEGTVYVGARPARTEPQQ